MAHTLVAAALQPLALIGVGMIVVGASILLGPKLSVALWLRSPGLACRVRARLLLTPGWWSRFERELQAYAAAAPAGAKSSDEFTG